MHILYIHQYFRLPEEPGGNRSYWISKELVRRGHKVTVITKCGTIHREACEVDIDGINVIYLKNYYSNYMSAPRKILSFMKFVFQALRTAKKQSGVDLVFATSTPLTVGYIALMLKAVKKWPYVFEVRDLWPEFPIEIGAIKNKLIIKYLQNLEKRIYKNSEYVVALSPGMQAGVVSTGFPVEKTAMIPNMSKPDTFFPHPADEGIVSKFGIDLSKFNVIHFGSMGRANGLMYIIEAAKICQEKGAADITFLFMGSGATEPLLKKKAEEYGLENVRFLGDHNMYVLSEIVNCCDASITSFLNLPVLRTNSPNKLFDSLSAGKPIIVNSSGWTKELVEKENCGFYADPENPGDFARKLMEYKDDKELLKTWGNNARRLSVEKYDQRLLSAQVADVLERAFSGLSE